ncbi:aspartate-alanine antiporter [Formicincola oecophyllae]|uniref:Aspartate-alanine antiporter n=1 Tax=Formicincola oecophyllae TaxID=2558361 RepID=A0A4Y6UBY8_9PROT|nr:aspartate-alanine antiporter [Formicincola oecophyllae]QDH13911.1 aspartate-alanine antiporter [Formicincola oecophyllae]
MTATALHLLQHGWVQGGCFLRQFPLVALFLAMGLGALVGRVRVGGFRPGDVAGALLVAVLLSQCGVTVAPQVGMVLFALFIYAIGFGSGPEFFGSLGRSSLREVSIAVVLALTSLLCVLACAWWWGFDPGTAAGIASGALTQSDIIGTADTAIERLGLPPAQVALWQANVAVGFAVTYIFGLVGTLFLICQVMPRLAGRSIREAALEAGRAGAPGQPAPLHTSNPNGALPELLSRVYRVAQPGLTVGSVEAMGVSVPRARLEGHIVTPAPDAPLLEGDLVMLLGPRGHVASAGRRIGPEAADAFCMDTVLMRGRVRLGKDAGLFGHSHAALLADIAPVTGLRVHLQGVSRNGKALAPNAHKARTGDIITLYGLPGDVRRAAQQLGVLLAAGQKSALAYHGAGLALGLALGTLTLHVGPVPLTLGTGGGCLVAGLGMGWWHGRHPHVGNLPAPAASLMVDLGLPGFVAVTGLNAGRQMVGALLAHGASMFAAGLVVTVVPVTVATLFALKVLKYRNSALLAGALAGARSSNPTFGEALTQAGNMVPARSFVVTYAMANVLLTLLGPLIVGLLR